MLASIAGFSLSGIGGIGYRHHDWHMTSTTLFHLIKEPWPVWFTPEYLGSEFGFKEPRPFIYYFSYYLPAAVIGKLFGWTAGRLALYAWTCFCSTLLFILIINYIKKQKASVKPLYYTLVPVYIFLMGGLDWWGHPLYHTGKDHPDLWTFPFVLLTNLRVLYWSPHHCLPVWLIAMVILHNVHSTTVIKLFLPTCVALLFWTPFGTVGLAPFIAWYLLSLFIHEKVTINIAAVVLSIFFVVIISTFLFSHSLSIPIQYTLTANWITDKSKRYLLFIITELAIPLILLLITSDKLKRTEVMFTGIAVSIIILVSPALRLGFWSDWCSRTGMASQFMLYVLVLKNVLTMNRSGRNFYIATSLIVISCFTSLGELNRAINEFKFDMRELPPDIRAYGGGTYVTNQVFGKPDSFFFTYLARRH
ncbi:hypothetical protein [Arsenicibacter rosenii]|nr:hypothetical protein [Arsenicibacter rosenii]